MDKTIRISKYSNLALKIISILWAPPIVFLIRILRPVVLIRFGTINSGRIGHFVTDSAEHLARMRTREKCVVDLFWLGPTANYQWEKMVRRSLRVRGWARLVAGWNRIIPGGEVHELPSSFTGSRDVQGLLHKHNVSVPFLPQEETEATNWLKSKGWTESEPFVCLMVRDSAYLKGSTIYGGPEERAKLDWSYHNYRDSDINTYLPAVSWLASQKIWVIRMGIEMQTPLATDQPYVLDYAFDGSKSELLDVWLFANCTACISTGTGPDAISRVYHRPTLYVNVLPLTNSLLWGASTWVPKKLIWERTEQQLSAQEYLAHGFFKSADYANAGIVVQDLSPDEILTELIDFWSKTMSGKRLTGHEKELQHKFRKIYVHRLFSYGVSPSIHPEARISYNWLVTAMDHEV